LILLSHERADLSDLGPAKAAAAPVIAYGQFLNTITNFLLVAALIFLVVQAISNMQKPVAATAPTTKDCAFCYLNYAPA